MFGMTEMWHFKQCGFNNAAGVNYSTRVKYSYNTVCTVPVRINVSALNVMQHLQMSCDFVDADETFFCCVKAQATRAFEVEPGQYWQ